jgi:hypothetical protein
MHYNSAQGVFPDRTAVDLMLEEQVERPADIEIRNQAELRLRPGQVEVAETFTFELGAGTLYGIAPHQHQIGRTIQAELVHADGSTTCLVDVPVWDFHWQGLYLYEDPVEVAAGDRLRVHCVWDTTSVDRVVEYGEGSADEMCVVLTYGAFEAGE